MTALAPFLDIDLPLSDRREGKVRVSYAWSGGCRLFVTTDRLSAFDRVIAGVPYKGQVLNQLSAWWFERLDDIVPTHLVSTPDPNVTVARDATPLPVEVVVRGYITGVTDTSLWRQYAGGMRRIYGYDFPDGLRKNTALPASMITPTTKAAAGGHDEPLSSAEVVERGLVEAQLWERTCDAARSIFARGQAVAESAGLILADTKFEFGTDADDRLVLIDEVLTPDSSRYWVADTYEAQIDAGQEPESLDKEVVRRALIDAGYAGDGAPPALADEVWEATSSRYIDAFERITATPFRPGAYPVAERLQRWYSNAC